MAEVVSITRSSLLEAERFASSQVIPANQTLPVSTISSGGDAGEAAAIDSLSLACDEACSAIANRLASLERYDHALEIGLTIRQDWHRVEALLELINRHSYRPDQIEAVCKSIRSTMSSKLRSLGLIRLSVHLPTVQCAAAQRESLNAANSISETRHHIEALVAIAAYLGEPFRENVLNQTLNLASSMRDGARKNEIVSWLVPRIAALGHASEALKAAQAIDDEISRAIALTNLAPTFTPQSADDLLREALRIHQRKSTAEVLVDFVTDLPESLLSDALEAIKGIGDETLKTKAFIRIAERIPEPLMHTAAQVAKALSSAPSRATALNALIPRMRSGDRSAAFQLALQDARAIEKNAVRSRVLGELSLHTTGPLKADIVREALGSARRMGLSQPYQMALTNLAPRLAELRPDELYPLWSEVIRDFTLIGRDDALDYVRILLPVIKALGGAEAVAEVVHAIQEVGRWWA